MLHAHTRFIASSQKAGEKLSPEENREAWINFWRTATTQCDFPRYKPEKLRGIKLSQILETLRTRESWAKTTIVQELVRGLKLPFQAHEGVRWWVNNLRDQGYLIPFETQEGQRLYHVRKENTGGLGSNPA